MKNVCWLRSLCVGYCSALDLHGEDGMVSVYVITCNKCAKYGKRTHAILLSNKLKSFINKIYYYNYLIAPFAEKEWSDSFEKSSFLLCLLCFLLCLLKGFLLFLYFSDFHPVLLQVTHSAFIIILRKNTKPVFECMI